MTDFGPNDVEKYWRDEYYARKAKYDASNKRLEELANVMRKLLDAEALIGGMEATLTNMHESVLSIFSNFKKMESEAVKDNIPNRLIIFNSTNILKDIGYNDVEASINNGITGKTGTNYWGNTIIDGELRPLVAKEIEKETKNRDTAEGSMKAALSAWNMVKGGS